MAPGPDVADDIELTLDCEECGFSGSVLAVVDLRSATRYWTCPRCGLEHEDALDEGEDPDEWYDRIRDGC